MRKMSSGGQTNLDKIRADCRGTVEKYALMVRGLKPLIYDRQLLYYCQVKEYMTYKEVGLHFLCSEYKGAGHRAPVLRLCFCRFKNRYSHDATQIIKTNCVCNKILSSLLNGEFI